MKKLTIFCCTHFHNNYIGKLPNLIPVGIGGEVYPENWLTDKSKNNISNLNKNYADLTFHYWIWKNYLHNFNDDDFFGFCQYRRFWLKSDAEKNIDFSNLNENLLNHLPDEFKNYDAILTNPERVNLKYKSVFKYRKLINNIKNPKPIFSKTHQTAGVQFEVYTKTGDLIYELANNLKSEDKKDFIEFLNKKNQINLHNMFITKKKIFNDYMEYLFDWLEKSDNEIQKYNSGGLIRLHAFLAERFLPFWFNKYCKTLNWPWTFCDTSKAK